VTVRPSLLRAALVALALAGPAAVLTGCAGAAPDSAGSTSSTTAGGAGSSGTPGTGPSAAASAAEGRRIEVQVTGGRVTGDTGRVPVAAGEHVTLVITSDVADEVHLHGYDLETRLSPGQPAELSFDATVPGVFEVELHDAGTQLLSLQVG
jgi:hypothetical protein